MISVGLYERTCKQCGKKFECRLEYAFRRYLGSDRYNYFCSYGCMRKYDLDHAKKPSPRQQRILDLVCGGMKVSDISEEVGVSQTYVRRVVDRWSFRTLFREMSHD